jgi:signal transduction histidine kinase
MTGNLSKSGFDELLREVADRVQGAIDERARWELLLDAVVTIGADLDLDGLLARIVTAASRLADAQYAALGVIGSSSEQPLRTFVHHGVTAEQVVEIGDLPTGHGLLGLIIDRPEPLRLHDIAEHAASSGFPANHPPMRSFLGVPIRIRDQVFGNLYLTEKAGGQEFTEQDERIVVALAAAAGVAIENARLYEEAAQRERWLAATAEITGLLSRTTDLDALQVVADRVRDLAGADVAWVVAGPDESRLAVQVVSGVQVDLAQVAGLSLDRSLAREVVRSQQPLAVPDMAHDPRAVTLDQVAGWPVLGPVIVVPFGQGGGVDGALALGWVPGNAGGFSSVDAALPASFAEQAALALQVSRSREDQQQLAVFQDRDRIARDLHDLVIQRLFAIGLGLESTSRLAENGDVSTRLGTAIDDLDDTIKDIRRTIFALGSLDQATDVQAEVIRLVERAKVTLKFRPTLTFDGPVRTVIGGATAADVLAVLGEALSNAARHANATAVDVRLAAAEDIVLEITDDGDGIDGTVDESGLRNMRHRAERCGGRCEIGPGPAGGTRVRWSVPLG